LVTSRVFALLRILITLIPKKKHNITGATIILINNINKDNKANNAPNKKPKKEGSNSSEISLVAFFLDLSDISLFVGSSLE
jgi:hypothetical protein